MNHETPSPFRDKIAYILGHEIIYSTQYQSIEFGRANEQLESLIAKEMGSFGEWLDSSPYIWWKDKGVWTDIIVNQEYTTTEVVQFYLNRDK